MTTESLNVTIDGETLTVEIGAVAAPAGGGGSSAWGAITGTLSDQTDLQSALDAKQAASATLTTLSSATAAGLALMDDADATAQRATLGLGTAATAASSAFEAAGAVATHEGATDPHGDRAYADGLASNYATAAQGATADTAVQPGDLATVATTGAYSDLSGLPTLGTAAALDVPAAGDAASGEVVKGSDSRLTDSRTPTSHTHPSTDISDSTAAGRALITAADAAAQRTALGLGTAATTAATDYATAAQGATADTAVQPADIAAQSTANWEAGVGTTESVVSPAKIAAAIAALAGSGGTATLSVFTPSQNQPPASAFATLDTRNSVLVLDFDDSTDEQAVFSGVIPEGSVLTSGIIARIVWMATTATSGNVRWRVGFERGTTDIDADSFDTATEATGAANGTSGIATTTEITATTIDSLVAGDKFRVRITRVGTDGTNDTMTGDAELMALELRAV